MEKQAGAGFAVNEIRKDFPILGDIIYLDNAATSFSPEPVIEAMVEFEHRYRANVGRGVHRFTQIASQRYWHAHEKSHSLSAETMESRFLRKIPLKQSTWLHRVLSGKPETV